MQNRHAAGRSLWFRCRAQSQHCLSNLWGIDTIVAAVESRDQLGEYTPDKGLLGILILDRQVADHPAEVAIAAVFHVEVQVLGGFEVLAMVVADNVWVSQSGENLELGVQLFTLLL